MFPSVFSHSKEFIARDAAYLYEENESAVENQRELFQGNSARRLKRTKAQRWQSVSFQSFAELFAPALSPHDVSNGRRIAEHVRFKPTCSDVEDYSQVLGAAGRGASQKLEVKPL